MRPTSEGPCELFVLSKFSGRLQTMSFLKPAAGAQFGGVSGLGIVARLRSFTGHAIRKRIGTAMNGIASGRRCDTGLWRRSAAHGLNNHLQMLDPEVLRSIISRNFGRRATSDGATYQ
jgi:hypothetical protein